MTSRIAIYARYSSKMQNPKSVEDQIADCRRFIETQPWGQNAEILTFSDRAITGKVTQSRPGYNGLIDALKRREISVLVAEGLDRISRDMGNSSHVYKMAEFYGADIYSLEDGKVSSIHVGIRSIMNDMYTDKVKHQVKRSQGNRAREGKMTGLAYGYKIKIKDEREATGERVIDEDKAVVIREIFEMYADGHSLASIVQILNARGIPSPRGGEWQKTALIGSIKRHEGILCNTLYRGQIIWNMKSKHINPETGGKNYFVNPESKWVIYHDESLRIVSEELWSRCDVRKFARKEIKKKDKKVHVFNPYRGLIFCGACGAKKALADRKRFLCRGWKAKRTCTNARSTRQHKILAAVETTLHEALAKQTNDDLLRHIDEKMVINQNAKALLQQELAELDARIEEASQHIRDKSLNLSAVTEVLHTMQHDRAALVVQLNQAVESPPENVKSLFSTAIDQLVRELNQPQINDNNRVLLHLVIHRITLTPIEGKSRGEDIAVFLAEDIWIKLYQFLARSSPS